ncbi:MAG: hypothetical protein EA402_06520 [Planctomycetota bacterium]|nr:MAG: hypothetical protein EA402_06520 [Planctomycetota bacterium]
MNAQHFIFHPDQSIAAFAAWYPQFYHFWGDHGLPGDIPAECSWREACQRAHEDPELLLGSFAALVEPLGGPDERDWTEVTLGELIENIVTFHHAFVRSQLGRMSAMLTRLTRTAPHPSARIDHARSAMAYLRQRWLAHMDMEEREFFPACLRLETSRDFLSRDELDSLVEALHRTAHDHHEIDIFAERLEQSLEAIEDDIADSESTILASLRGSLAQFIDDARVHSSKEDDILLPAVLFVHDIRRSDTESGRFTSQDDED